MADRRIWIWPMAAALIYLLLLGLGGSHWTWSLYDELSWIEYFSHTSALSYIKRDFINDGRFRPLSQLINYARFSLFGIQPQILRVERICELYITVTAAAYYLVRQKRLPLFAVAFGLAFWLKSPPLLEQMRWLTVIELPGIFFLVLALILRPKSIPLSYVPLLFAAMTKEPMALMLALPAALDRRWKEFSICFAASIGYIAFLFLNRHGYSSLSTFNAHAIIEIARQSAIDFAPLVLLAAFIFKNLKSLRWSPESWMGFVFLIFAGAYSAMVFRMAWGYTYIFAPSVFLIAMGLTFTLSAAHKFQKFSKQASIVCFILIVLFSGRVAWNWTKNYKSMAERHKLFQAVADSTNDGIIGTNCHRDRRGIGFAADLIKNKNPLQARLDGPSCANQENNIYDCCNQAQFVALSSECSFFSERMSQVKSVGLKEIYSNSRWALFKCQEPPR